MECNASVERRNSGNDLSIRLDMSGSSFAVSPNSCVSVLLYLCKGWAGWGFGVLNGFHIELSWFPSDVLDLGGLVCLAWGGPQYA